MLLNHRATVAHLFAMVLMPAAMAAQAATPLATAPPAAYSVGAAFDNAAGHLVVFGGYSSGRYVGDTWMFDRQSWARSTRPGPPARNSPSLVFDEKRGRVLMFGGDSRPTGDLGDTWERVGDQWRQLSVAGPPARSTHVMAYDVRRDRVVLFGGFAGGEGIGDTWEFDGDRWTRAATAGPSPRGLFAMTYDAARGKTVLFGGNRSPQPDSPPLGDTWEWNGEHWTQINVTGPSARDHTQMVYDPVRQVVVLHGGGGDDEAAQTWTYDGRAWKRESFAGPVRRNARMVFDSRSRAVLLYGGFAQQPSNELWRLEGAGWKRLSLATDRLLSGQPNEVRVPKRASAVIDGRLAPGEWDGSFEATTSDGSTIYLRHDGEYLYLGARLTSSGFPSVCVTAGDTLRILHSSAAVASAVYTRNGISWRQRTKFTFALRSPDTSAAGKAAQRNYLAAERWVASNDAMSPREREMQIALTLMDPEDARIALGLYIQKTDGAVGWPTALSDGCTALKSVQGWLPVEMTIEPAKWVRLRFDGGR